MKYLVVFCSAVLFLVLWGCSEKKEKNSGLVTPVIDTTQIEEKKSKQLLPDTVDTLGNLVWHSNVKEAFNLAKDEDKNVIIMVGEDNCRWCIKMKKKTLSDARIQEIMQGYVLVSVKRSDKQAIAYVPEFDGNIPSFFFMTKEQELLEPLVGYFNADDFYEYIKEIEEL